MNFLEKIENEELRSEIKTAFEKEISDAKEAAINDPEMVREFKKQGFKEAERKFVRDLKKTFGVDSADLDDATDFTEMFKVVKEKQKDGLEKTSQEWQDKYLALKQDYTKLKDEDIPALKQENENKFKQMKINTHLISKLSSYEHLTIDKSELEILVDGKMQRNGILLDLDGDKVVAKTADGTRPIVGDKAVDFDGLIDSFVSPFVKQSGSSDSGKPSGTFTAPNGGELNDAQRAALEKMKEKGISIPSA